MQQENILRPAIILQAARLAKRDSIQQQEHPLAQVVRRDTIQNHYLPHAQIARRDTIRANLSSRTVRIAKQVTILSQGGAIAQVALQALIRPPEQVNALPLVPQALICHPVQAHVLFVPQALFLLLMARAPQICSSQSNPVCAQQQALSYIRRITQQPITAMIHVQSQWDLPAFSIQWHSRLNRATIILL